MATREVVIRWEAEKGASWEKTCRSVRQDVERMTSVQYGGRASSANGNGSSDAGRRDRIAAFEAEQREMNRIRQQREREQTSATQGASRVAAWSMNDEVRVDRQIRAEQVRQAKLFAGIDKGLDADNAKAKAKANADAELEADFLLAQERAHERAVLASQRAATDEAKKAERAQRQQTREVTQTALAYQRLGSSAIRAARGVAFLMAGKQGSEELLQSIVMIQGAVDLSKAIAGRGGMLAALAKLGVPLGAFGMVAGGAALVGGAAYGAYRLGVREPEHRAEISSQRYQEALANSNADMRDAQRRIALNSNRFDAKRELEQLRDELSPPLLTDIQQRIASRRAQANRVGDDIVQISKDGIRRGSRTVHVDESRGHYITNRRGAPSLVPYLEGYSDEQMSKLSNEQMLAVIRDRKLTVSRTSRNVDEQQAERQRLREDELTLRRKEIDMVREKMDLEEDEHQRMVQNLVGRMQLLDQEAASIQDKQLGFALLDPRRQARLDAALSAYQSTGQFQSREDASLVIGSGALRGVDLEDAKQAAIEQFTPNNSAASKAYLREQDLNEEERNINFRAYNDELERGQRRTAEFNEQLAKLSSEMQELAQAVFDFKEQIRDIEIQSDSVTVKGQSVKVEQEANSKPTAFNFQAQQMRALV